MKISTVAKSAGVGIETVRFYERRKLIEQPLKPRDGGIRSYPYEMVVRIKFIRRAQELGFSLKEVTELLSLQTDPESDCSDVRTRAVIKHQEVIDKIDQLKAIKSALERVIGSCTGSGSATCCSILDELEKGAKK